MRSPNKRSRSKGNRPKSLGNIVNRVFDSSGPEGKVRGTPQQIIEKYQVLARDAQLSNDRVAAENFQQHAEHYTRLLAQAQRELQAEQDARRQQHEERSRQSQEERPQQNARRNEPRHAAEEGAFENGTRNGAARESFAVQEHERNDEPSLVETPESRVTPPSEESQEIPAKPANRRKPRARADAKSAEADDSVSSETFAGSSETGEPEAPAKPRRVARKPRRTTAAVEVKPSAAE